MQKPMNERDTFRWLCNLLNLKESKLIRHKGGSVHMSRGLTLDRQSFGDGLRLQVNVYDGTSTSCSQVLYSIGRRAFEDKVRAIAVGKEIKRLTRRK